jgi:hypothetical protein
MMQGAKTWDWGGKVSYIPVVATSHFIQKLTLYHLTFSVAEAVDHFLYSSTSE